MLYKKNHGKTFPDLKERGDVLNVFSVIDFLDKIIMDSSLMITTVAKGFDTENHQNPPLKSQNFSGGLHPPRPPKSKTEQRLRRALKLMISKR